MSLVCCRNKLLVFCLCDRTLADDAPHFYTDSYIMWLLALVENIIAYSLLSSVLTGSLVCWEMFGLIFQVCLHLGMISCDLMNISQKKSRLLRYCPPF